jgi:hypothetical protein
MATIFVTLLVVIAVAGSVHTIASHYLDKAQQRRKREALMRLNLRAWK